MTGAPEGSPKVVLCGFMVLCFFFIFMEKPGIEPATPGLQGIALIHYTTGASQLNKLLFYSRTVIQFRMSALNGTWKLIYADNIGEYCDAVGRWASVRDSALIAPASSKG